MVKEVRHDNSCRFRLYPNKEQRELIAKTFGCCRWVYNWGLAMRKKAWEEEKKSLSLTDIQSQLPAMKKDAATSWLKEVDAKALIFSLRCMDTAYQNFFKHQSGFPRFKAKYERNQSYQTYQDVSFSYDKSKLYLPKMQEGIKCIFSRKIEGKIKTCTISRNPAGEYCEYYVSIIVETEGSYLEPPAIKPETAVGIDAGVKNLAILSDGQKFPASDKFRKSERHLAHLQRILSRRTKGGKNWEKARVKVARAQNRIRNQRNDLINNVVADIIKKGYETICVENLSIKDGMLQDKKHGKHNKQKRSRNKLIVDAAMGMLRIKLQQKCKSKGINFIKIERYFPSSKTCHCCGKIFKGLQLSQRSWVCPSCRAKLDRDVNAAINIKNFGISNSSLGRCTPEVKSVEHRKQKRKNAKSSDVSDVEKQK